MTALHHSLGIVTRTGDTFEIAFERRLAQPIDKVWAAITTAERIADWLAHAEVDLRVGGRFALRFTEPDYAFEGVIVELDPPRLIAWTWPHEEHPDSVVRWELFPETSGCRLVMTQSRLVQPLLTEVAAGWHALLESLPGAAGGPVVRWTRAREQELFAIYEDRLPR